MPTLTEQVESLISFAQKEADRTGVRQRVEGARTVHGVWYYYTRNTARWPHRLTRP